MELHEITHYDDSKTKLMNVRHQFRVLPLITA